ncbi:MAG TPA: hypothetical protein VMU69_20165 [Bradyrhizobium sp.]|nr:hypothetical protein [Bradyrhizobium sp.]
MAGGILPNAVLSAYDGLVNALRQASEDANVGFVKFAEYPSARFRVDPNDQNTALLDLHLHLMEWKARGDTLSILLHAREAINRKTQVLMRSSVHLSYYRVKGKEAKLLHNVHFDYDGEQDYHPVFHVQLCKDDVVLPKEITRKLEFQYKRGNNEYTCYRDARIPTSDMTFASVLLCLAADHLVQGPFFKNIFDSVCAHQEEMPRPKFAKTKASIAKTPNHLGSSHWFAHMF